MTDDSTAEKAWEEAFKRYPPSMAAEGFPGEGDRYVNDEWGYDECQQKAFVAGAEWARASRDTEVAELREQLTEARVDLDARFEHSDHLSAKYYKRMRDAERRAEGAEEAAPLRERVNMLEPKLTETYKRLREAQAEAKGASQSLAEAQATIERVTSAVNGPHPANSGLDSFTLAHISAALSASSSTGGAVSK